MEETLPLLPNANCKYSSLGRSQSFLSGTTLNMIDSEESVDQKTLTPKITQSDEDGLKSSHERRFPSHLWTRIAAKLDTVSVVYLKSTNYYLHTIINTDGIEFSKCEKWIINRRFRKDMDVLVREQIYACILC